MFILIYHPVTGYCKELITSEDGKWEYQILESGDGEIYASIYRYNGTDEILVIPSEFGEYKVRELDGMILLDNNTVKEITIPETVMAMDQSVFSTAYALEKINIEKPTEAGFHTVDGVFYNGKNLITYPAAKQQETYIIPEGTEVICCGAFYGCSKLKKVIIPNSVYDIYSSAFSRSTQPIDIIIKKKYYKSKYLKNTCWQMKSGTRFLVANEELKELYASEIADGYSYNDNPLYNNNHYSDSMEPMAVEMAESVSATSLTFTDGSTEKHVLIDYADGADNTYYLHSLYTQVPADTTENVCWSVLSGGEYCKVSSGGTLVTTSGGEAVLKATDESGHELTLNVTIYCPMTNCEIFMPSVDSRIGLISGDTVSRTIMIGPVYSYAANADVVSWEVADTSIATVEKDGQNRCLIHGISLGTTVLTATINDNGNIVKRTKEIYVYDNLENCTIDPIPDQVYTGEQICPVPVVRYKGEVLTEGVDYSVSYGENILPGFANGTIGIQSLNNSKFYQGDYGIGVCFNIIPPEDNGEYSPDQPSETTQPTNNDQQNPDTGNSSQTGGDSVEQITGVKDSYTKAYGSKNFTLKAKGPAAVTYASSDKKVITVGKTSGKVTIKGIGRATITITSGKLTKKVTIKINPKKLSSVKASASGKKAIKVSWKRDKMATGYQVQYATNSKFTKGKKTETIKKNKTISYTIKKLKSKKTISYTIKKLKSKKKYHVRVRAYKVVKGKTYYSDWSGVKNIRVR